MVDASVLLIRGGIGIMIGILAILWPGLTITFLVLLFGVYALLDGVTNVLLGARRSPRGDRSWSTMLRGILGVAAGIVAFFRPGITALALLWFIGAWAVVAGIFEIAAAVRLRREIEGEWLLALSGTLSILLGLVLFAFPALAAVGLAIAFGAFAVASGIVLVALAVRLRSRAVAA
jgi:uncharacterized membrane protein HdeD (DUF308 family)